MLLAQLPAAAAAGQLERRIQSMTNAEIVAALRQSGLTVSQIRQRMTARGLDPSLAEPYFQVLEGTALTVPPDTDSLSVMALVNDLAEASVVWDPSDAAAPPDVAPSPPPDPGPQIFGRALFRRATTEFEPVVTGPVPPDYRVGPGDEVALVLTGGVEQAYRLTVTREGWVVIPDVGRVSVAGSTLEQLEALLFRRLSQVYSGITRGSDATTYFDVTLGRLRTSQIYAIGEVERPGAYTVSSLATVLTALYRAGGPNRGGSFRNVRLHRRGSFFAEIDLYDYLIRGDASRDVRLEQGDILFVPVVGRRVEISGPIIRPGIYEVEEDESLRDLIRMAGGLEPFAESRRVQIERILTPEDRVPGADRAILDIELPPPGARPDASVSLQNGDLITVFAVLEELRNDVVVSGGVWRPGRYAAEPGVRLWDVIERAGGLLPDVVEGRAQIQRLKDNYSRRLIPVSLVRDAAGVPSENPLLEGQDQIVVFTERTLRDPASVRVAGWVREPGTYPFHEGMTVADALLLAGGLRDGAYLDSARVSRPITSNVRADQLRQEFTVPLDSAFLFEGRGALTRATANNPSATEAARFPLQALDAIDVRRAPGYAEARAAKIEGEVGFPGEYLINRRSTRLHDLIERAGGLTEDAYARGFQLWRLPSRIAADTVQPQALRVGVDLPAMLADPSDPSNIVVEPGDSLFVPRYIPTVEVRGAVGVPSQVLYEAGASVDYYLRRAGGYLEEADGRRTRVHFANGDIASPGWRFLVFGGGLPDPDPGSVIFVPQKLPQEGTGMSVSELVGLVSSVVTAVALAIVATSGAGS